MSISNLVNKFISHGRFLEFVLMGLSRKYNKHPPIFIVGPPRCGTTIVYLHIINRFQCSYFPNISKWNPRKPLLAATLGNLVWNYSPTVESTYGIVEGPMAPSDGWHIFHRWFPRYDHSEPVDTDTLTELRRIVAFLESLFGGPFINKNNNNSTRIRELSRLFPKSVFVHVRRNPQDAVASLIRAREQHNVASDEWWSVAPPQCYDTAPPDTVERAILQICKVDEYICDSLQELSSHRFIQVDYETFCGKPASVEDWVETRYRMYDVQLKRRMRADLNSRYSPSSSWSALSPSIQEQVETILTSHCKDLPD